MNIEIRQESAAALAEYATLPISFWVRSRLRVDRDRMIEEPVEPAYLKEYDALGESPSTWEKAWDLDRCGILVARDAGMIVGGAMVAPSDDVATLVDLRVSPQRRRQGIGGALMQSAIEWARRCYFGAMQIETQDNNVAACRLYAKHGAKLCGVFPGRYNMLPEEVMLLWEIRCAP
jgi:ribosomal protein S18 acetylase RimI-like enzyme